MKKRIISLALVALMLATALLSLGSCGLFGTETDDGAKATIYDMVNSSKANSITTSVDYATKDGVELPGWYVVKREGNDMIVEYDYKRFATIEESVATGSLEKVINEVGAYYYHNGKYYDKNDETKTPFVGSPLEYNFKLNIDKSKLLTENTPMNNSNERYVTMTAESCKDMLGVDLNAVGTVNVRILTNGVQLSELEVMYNTASGASVTVLSTYDYGNITLDFGDYFEEEAE
jgi:hypothetical protein